MIADCFVAIWDILKNSATYEIAVGFTAVLGFAAIGEWVAEKSGTMNISLEGMILGSAFAAAVGYDIADSSWVGLAFGIIAGLSIASIQANMSYRLEINQFVVGLTLNVLILALVSFLFISITPISQITSDLNILPFSKIPLFGGAFFEQSWILYLIVPFGILAWWLVYKTRWGLELRAVGENPNSATKMGISVMQRRRQAIYFCGIAAGLSGSYLLLGQVGRFEINIVGGQGFIVLATVIFGGWRLGGALLGCSLIGFVTALRLILPALGHSLNTELLAALPFIVAILALALIAPHQNRKNRQPAALGIK